MSGEISRALQYIKDNLFIQCLQCTNDKIKIEEKLGVIGKADYHICELCKARYTLHHVLGIKLIELEKRIRRLEDNYE